MDKMLKLINSHPAREQFPVAFTQEMSSSSSSSPPPSPRPQSSTSEDNETSNSDTGVSAKSVKRKAKNQNKNVRNKIKKKMLQHESEGDDELSQPKVKNTPPKKKTVPACRGKRSQSQAKKKCK